VLGINANSNGQGRIDVALIGAGIGRSLSRALHEREGRLLGFDYRYDLYGLDQLGQEAQDVGRMVEQARADGLWGLNVTGKADGLIHATPTGMPDHAGTAVPAELLRSPESRRTRNRMSRHLAELVAPEREEARCRAQSQPSA
jgi:shikimate 5-dehydrogenase